MPLNYSFSRYGPALNPGKDLDWNTDRYVIYGLRTNGESRYQVDTVSSEYTYRQWWSR